mgnify:CR=1 FL=1|tara:strand:+ start:13514 stop:14590 length:1077 start_codon:yes stop_codon:yes gene_type:complete
MQGKVYIIGDIGSGSDFTGIELIDVVSQVKAQPEATSFDVYINSGGGVVETGDDIYNYLKSLPQSVTTIGSGVVASIATVIFMAGSVRKVTPNTEFMIHLPTGSADYLSADQLDLYAKEIKNIENRMVKFYCQNTNLEAEAVLPLLRNETWLTNDQLKNFGFTNSEQMLAVAKANININPKQKTMSKKAETMLSKIFDAVVGKQKPTSKILYNADDQEVDFYELDEETMPSVGDMANVAGSLAEGSYVMADGQTFVFVAGALTEIVEVEEDEELTLEEAKSQLEIANATIANLEGKTATLKADLATAKSSLEEKTEIVDKITAMRSKFIDSKQEPKVGGKKATPKQKSRFATAIASVK